MYKRWFVFIIMGVLIFGLIGGCAPEPPVTPEPPVAPVTPVTPEPPVAPEVFTLVVSDGHPIHMPCATVLSDTFIPEATRLAKAAGYDLVFKENYGGSLTKCLETLEGTESGLCDIGFVHNPFEPAKMPLHNVTYFTPFSSPDPRQVLRVVLQMCEDFPWLEEYPEKTYNQKVLAHGAVDCYHLITTFPFKTPGDLKGRKICAAGPNLEWLEAVGAIPVQGTLMEAYTDLQTGVYDGWVMLADPCVSFKLYEPAPYYTLCDFGAQWVGMLTINLDTWNGLPKGVQNALVKAGELYSVEQPKLTYEKGLESLKILKEECKGFYELSDADKASWADSLSNIPDRHAQEVNAKGMPGTEVYRAYIELLEEEGFTFLRRWEID